MIWRWWESTSTKRDDVDRTALARSKRRRLSKPGLIEQVIDQSRQVAMSLRESSHEALSKHTEQLRHFSGSKETELAQMWSLAAGGVIEAIRQCHGIELFDVQIRAGVIVSAGAVAEMQTGEGKTYSAALPAYVQALAGRGVHVATPNQYLAGRDHGKLQPVFERLGMTVGLLDDQAKPHETKAAYDCDITYGPGHAFGFDYLRDQLTLSPSQPGQVDAPRLGIKTLQRVTGCSPESRLLQRGLYASIIDEVDHVLLDDAVSPLLLSASGKDEAMDAAVHQAACQLASELDEPECYTINGGSASLTDEGFARVYADETMAVHDRLIRPWHEYVVLALRARHVLRRDVDYVVRDDDIQIIDSSTGRIFEDRTWSEGLHQAIQAIEGLRVTTETLAMARITRQRFYRYYESLGGMTGTATGCEREFASVYGLPVMEVPLRVPSRRRLFKDYVCATRAEKIAAIVEETVDLHEQGRAVLIGTLNIAESLNVASELAQQGLVYQLLNGVQDADEASIVEVAGQPGAITVATNLAGRGTDISLAESVSQAGGLHVIVTEKHSLSRVDRQLIGRCARCGDPGTARVYLSAEDELIEKHAPWIGRAIRRRCASVASGGAPPFEQGELDGRLSSAQKSLQRGESAQRWNLLQADQRNEQLLNKTSSSPSGCWQL